MFHPNGILSGPGSRLWEIALALKRQNNNITIAELNHEKDYTKEGIKFISWDNQRLKNIDKEFNVAFLPLSAYVHQYFDKIKKIPTIIDLSTPIAIEAMVHSIGNKNEFYLYDGIIPTFSSIAQGDFFICSNKSQKYFYLGMISLLGINNFSDELIKIAPLAPRIQKPKYKKRKILSKIVGDKKKIILFMGGLYSWYDYRTPIETMKDLQKSHTNSVLVFVGALNPNIPALTKNNYLKAKNLSKKLGLLNSSVFFIDWVPTNDRWNIYDEATIALVTSKESSESALSYRMRIIDFWYGNLPVISSRNDELSYLIDKKKIGATIEVENKTQLTKKLIEIFDNNKLLKLYKKNLKHFILTEFNIDKTLEPLNNFIKNPISINFDTRIDFFKTIEQQKHRIKNLEYIKNDKEGVNKSLVNEIKKLQKISKEQRDSITELEYIKKKLSKKTNNLLEENNTFNTQIIELSHDIKKFQEHLRIKEGILKNQKIVIGRFRSSIIYPFYKITHIIGKTKIGKILQKIK